MSTNILRVFEKLKKNKNISNKITLSENKQSLEIKFHGFLHVTVFDEGHEYTVSTKETHWHLDTDDEVIRNLTEIANGDIVFIRNTGLFAQGIKIVMRDEMEAMFGKPLFGRKNQRIYTGNMIFKREKGQCFEWELIPTDPPEESSTYLIPRNELTSTLNYEFQKGQYKIAIKSKHRLADSLFLYEDDLEGMMPFAYFIEDFDPYGVTYLDAQSGGRFVKYLREFAELLKTGKSVIQIVEGFNFYDSSKDWPMDEEAKQNMLKGKGFFKYGNWTEEKISQMLIDSKRYHEEGLKSLDSAKLQKTAIVLSDWIEEQLENHGRVSILGI
ncbi:MAG: hypothetical protein FWE01_01710 [Firmicutes bacterium]|nr:hypothetical protein [Bacillota bacterium]